MKRILWILLSLSIVFTQTPDSRGYIVKVGDPSPKWTLSFLDGSETALDGLKGNVIMLQFTASWCSVCREEMPHIEREIWLPNINKGLVVIGVDRDEPKEIVEAFAKEMNISYPLALDPNAEIFGLFADKESGVTRNVIINQEGKIVFLTRLYDKAEFDEMKNIIAELLQNS